MFDCALALTMFSKLVCLLVKVETDDAEQTFNLYLFEYQDLSLFRIVILPGNVK